MADGFTAGTLSSLFETERGEHLDCFVHLFDGQVVGLFAYDRRSENKSLYYHPLDENLYALFPKRRERDVETAIPSILANLLPDTYRASIKQAETRTDYYGGEYTRILSRNGLLRISYENFIKAQESGHLALPSHFDPEFTKETIRERPVDGIVIPQEQLSVRDEDLENIYLDNAPVSGKKPKTLASYIMGPIGSKGKFIPASAGYDATHLYKFANGLPARIFLEAAGLLSARAIGLRSACFNLVKTFAPNYQPTIDIAIERFDTPGDQMVLMQDFYSLFGYDSSDASVNGALTYSDLLQKWVDYLTKNLPKECIDEYGQPISREDKIRLEARNFIDRVYLSCFLTDNDLHPKNMSALIVVDEGTKEIKDIQMSPVYDALPAIKTVDVPNDPYEMFLYMTHNSSHAGKKCGWTDMIALDRCGYRYGDIRPVADFLAKEGLFKDSPDPMRAYLSDKGAKVYECFYQYFIKSPNREVSSFMERDPQGRMHILSALETMRERILSIGLNMRLERLPDQDYREVVAYRKELKERISMSEAAADPGVRQREQAGFEAVCN